MLFLFVLDNCSAHPDPESVDGKVIAKFLPPNVTALIQTQGVSKEMIQEVVTQAHNTSISSRFENSH